MYKIQTRTSGNNKDDGETKIFCTGKKKDLQKKLIELKNKSKTSNILPLSISQKLN